MPKIFTFGETVYDIIFKDTIPVAAKAGGSMLNTSVSLGRLGLNVNFISDLGGDDIGDSILSFLSQNGVTTDCIVRYPDYKTSIAIAFLNGSNDASYTFYKDFPLNRLENLKIDFQEGDIILFGSFFSITESIRNVLLTHLKRAREIGCLIIYDPNFRKPHLHELSKLKPYIIENIRFSDLVRGSDEDFHLIFEADSPSAAYEKLLDFGCENMIYTANRNDVMMYTLENKIIASVPSIIPKSTIGAGDTFNAGLIYTLMKHQITKKDMEHLQPRVMQEMLSNGISFATDVCMSYDNYISTEFATGIKNS